MAEVPLENIQSVALKLPQFWADEANIWFAQAESQFSIKNITSKLTKYHHVVAALLNEIAVKLVEFFKMYREKNSIPL